MRVWVQTINNGRFSLPVSAETQIHTFKEQITTHLATQNIHVPKDHQLASRGRILSENISLHELGTIENDSFFFLYDLNADVEKPQPAPQPTPMTQLAPTGPTLDCLKDLVGNSESLDGFPFPSEDAIQNIMMMGFPRFIAQKALIVCRFDVETAVEWIVECMDDPLLYDSVPLELLRDRFLFLYPEARDTMTKMIKECVANNKCTILATKKSFEQQAWFKCFTCGFVDDQGICEGCAKICHANHSLSPDQSAIHSSGFYCDCGTEASCKCNQP